MSNNNFGTLLNKDIILHRKYFKEMVKLIGINVLFKAPKASKSYDRYGELETDYCEPIIVGSIFEDHPDQKTLKKLGWVHELQESSSLIHVPFDLEDLQQGALFIVPNAYNPNEGRVFRVIKLSAMMIYPASIVCELAPEFASSFDRDDLQHSNSNFNLLKGE